MGKEIQGNGIPDHSAAPDSLARNSLAPHLAHSVNLGPS
jgi:hypothetical protein